MNTANHWDNRKNANYRYFDFVIKRTFDVSGVGVLVHAYEGNNTSTDTANDATSSALAGTKSVGTGSSTISDPINMTTGARTYSYPPYELKVIYNLQEIEWLILQFGISAQNSFYVETHLNDCIAKLGRKIMVGDVIQFRNMREDALLDMTKPAIDAFYQVTSVSRAMDGWDMCYLPHILRMQVQPITASIEFSNLIIENPDGTSSKDHITAAITGADDGTGTGNPGTGSGGSITDILSNSSNLAAISDAVVAAADYWVKYRNFDGGMLYVLDTADTGLDYPYLWTGDGVPPNGAQLAGSGKVLPSNPNNGDWFLLLRDKPDVDVLYQYVNSKWVYKECDFKIKWESAGRILESFFNNDNITTVNGVSMPEKQPISTIINDNGKQ